MRALTRGTEDVDIAEAYAWPSEVGLRANMACSVDGATAVSGVSRGVSSDTDRAVFALLRGLADVIVVGAGTVRAEGYGPARSGTPIAIVSGSLAGLDPGSPLFTEPRSRSLLLTTDQADAAAFEGVAEVVRCGTDRVDVVRAIASLRERGLGKVLCEGGPGLLAQVSAAGLLDELCLTVSPVLAGGSSRRVTDGPDLDPAVGLELRHVLVEEGTLFLRYARA